MSFDCSCKHSPRFFCFFPRIAINTHQRFNFKSVFDYNYKENKWLIWLFGFFWLTIFCSALASGAPIKGLKIFLGQFVYRTSPLFIILFFFGKEKVRVILFSTEYLILRPRRHRWNDHSRGRTAPKRTLRTPNDLSRISPDFASYIVLLPFGLETGPKNLIRDYYVLSNRFYRTPSERNSRCMASAGSLSSFSCCSL